MERQVIAEILIDATKLKVMDVKPEWFEDKHLASIVEDLNEHQEEDVDLLMMAERIKIKNPNTAVTQSLLLELATEAVSNARLENHIKELKIKYYQRKLSNMTLLYTKDPKPSNYRKLKDAMIDLDNVQNAEKEKDGDLTETIETFMEEMENGVKSGIKTYKSVDAVMGDGMDGGTFLVIGARPAVGKTTMALNLAVMAKQVDPDAMVDFYSLEMVQKEMFKKFISRLSGINSYKFVNTKLQLTPKEKNRVVAEAAYFESSGIGLMDNKMVIDDIIRSIRRRYYTSKGKYIAFIDYLQLINGNEKKQRYEQIGEVTRKLKLLANELQIVIVALSQVSRDVDKRSPKRPTLADLRESGDIEQDASAVAFLWPEEEDGESTGIVNFEIAKNRHGKTATIPFKFFKSISLFEEILA